MNANIRPFDAENTSAMSSDSSTDARVTNFMESLRARNSARDEAQREIWAKDAQPATKQKPVGPARPVWLKASHPVQDPKKAGSGEQFKRFTSKKRKPKA